jgi:hypothetical protein
MAGITPLPAGPDADAIYGGFRDVLPTYSLPQHLPHTNHSQFGHYFEDLLTTLITKAGILEKIPAIGQPVADVLGSLETSLDASTPVKVIFASSLIYLVSWYYKQTLI